MQLKTTLLDYVGVNDLRSYIATDAMKPNKPGLCLKANRTLPVSLAVALSWRVQEAPRLTFQNSDEPRNRPATDQGSGESEKRDKRNYHSSIAG